MNEHIFQRIGAQPHFAGTVGPADAVEYRKSTLSGFQVSAALIWAFVPDTQVVLQEVNAVSKGVMPTQSAGPGLPLLMWPIMVPVEILSMFTKPFALMVRLFANMLAGHMVVTTLILLISLMAQIHWLGGLAMTPVSIGLGMFILLLEVLVAFIQAYIFTLLSAIFIGIYAHPAH